MTPVTMIIVFFVAAILFMSVMTYLAIREDAKFEKEKAERWERHSKLVTRDQP